MNLLISTEKVGKSNSAVEQIVLSSDEVTKDFWNSIVASFSNSHVFQTWEWGQFKHQFGWIPHHIIWQEEQLGVCAAALVLQRKVPIPGFKNKYSVMYVPKGPLVEWDDLRIRKQILEGLLQFAYKHHTIFIKIDPDVNYGVGYPSTENEDLNETGVEVISDLKELSWKFSEEQIQFRNTVVIDLTQNQDEILARMKQKTRYNIRLAQRKDVRIRQGGENDLEELYHLYAKTSVRDGFVIREKEYYLSLWKAFIQAGMATPLIAEIEEQMVAGLILFYFSGKAWFLYGMSSDLHRERMPNYLLQWEAIQLAKAIGCNIYDLWGAPDELAPDDPLWGVYRFKEGFGGKVIRHLGAWDCPVQPRLYRLYTETLPRLLSILRWKGKLMTRGTIV